MAPDSRLSRLQSYLAQDPDNLGLLSEAADAAVEAGDVAAGAALIDRAAALAPLSPALLNLLSVIALIEARWADAARIAESLLNGGSNDRSVRLNLAWARSNLRDDEGVLEALAPGPATAAEATLAVRALHALGRLDDALAIGRVWPVTERNDDFWGALASVAIDAEAIEDAAAWSARAPAHPESRAVEGMLALADGRLDLARETFAAGLSAHPESARLELGLASVLLQDGDPRGAAERFDAAAETFGDHLGSWAAAGWAWLVAGQDETAAARFEHLLSLDDTFAEGHGGLAVLAIRDGRPQDARRLADVALRLDRNSLGGALARTLLLDAEGETELAARIRAKALSGPVGPNGLSIEQMAARLASRTR